MSIIGVTTPSSMPNSVSIPTVTSIKKNMIDHSVGKGSLLIVSVNTRNAKARPAGTWKNNRIQNKTKLNDI